MFKLTNPVKVIKQKREARAYDEMIKASQAKLALTTPVEYTRVIA